MRALLNQYSISFQMRIIIIWARAIFLMLIFHETYIFACIFVHAENVRI